jgi:hypothetical protein
MTAELRINELLEQVKLVKREAEIGPQGAASFWQAISETLLRDRQRLAMIDGSAEAPLLSTNSYRWRITSPAALINYVEAPDQEQAIRIWWP